MNKPEQSKPEKEGENAEENSREETLAERSARLEAEAAAMYEKKKPEEFNPPDGYDPLDPEPLPEELTQAMEGLSSADNVPDNAATAALQEELETTKDQLARALAEAENTRRRAQKEREDASKFAISKFAKDLLEVSDNLRRAIEAFPQDLAEAEPRIQTMIDGIEATERSLLATYERNGIVKIEPMDEPFDPNFHEVMFEAAVPGKPAGIVMQVMEAGYLLNDRLIRPARVGVTKNDGGGREPPPGTPDPSTPGGQVDTEA